MYVFFLSVLLLLIRLTPTTTITTLLLQDLLLRWVAGGKRTGTTFIATIKTVAMIARLLGIRHWASNIRYYIMFYIIGRTPLALPTQQPRLVYVFASQLLRLAAATGLTTATATDCPATGLAVATGLAAAIAHGCPFTGLAAATAHGCHERLFSASWVS